MSNAPAAAAKPDLAVTKLAAPGLVLRGEQNLVRDTVANSGSPARASHVHYVLSADRKLGRGDVRLGSRSVAPLKRGGSDTGTSRLAIPKKLKLRSGFVLACADGKRKVAESKERNNCRASATRVRVGARPAKPRPLDVQPELDRARAASAVISEAGGQITATGADGTRFTLTIPDKALLGDQLITMTPVSAVGDLPFGGGLGGAVQLEPDGLQLARPGTLLVVPTKPIPAGGRAGFSWSEAGKDFHLELLSRDADKIELEVPHFSGGGVAPATAAEVAAQSNRIPRSRESAARQAIADALLEAERTGNYGKRLDEELTEQLEILYYASVRPQLIRALTDAAALDRAVVEYFRWVGLVQASGLASLNSSSGRVEGPLAPEYRDAEQLVVQALEAGVERAMTKCLEQHDTDQATRLMKLAAILQSGFKRVDALALLKRCLAFELDYHFVYTRTTDGGKVVWNGDIGADALPIELDIATGWKGEKALAYKSFTVTGSQTGSAGVSGIDYNEPLKVFSMNLIGADGKPRVSMSLDPGQTTEHWSWPSGGQFNENNYRYVFSNLFKPEFAADALPTAYLFPDWQHPGGAVKGHVELTRSGDCGFPGNSCSGTLTMTLRHTPK